MNDKHIELIEAYVAGDLTDVQPLLDACKTDPDVLKLLADQVSMNQLLKLEAIDEGADVFAAEQVARIEAGQVPAEDDLAHRVRQKLSENPGAPVAANTTGMVIRLITFGGAIAAILFLSFMLMQDPNEQLPRPFPGTGDEVAVMAVVHQSVGARWQQADSHGTITLDGEVGSMPMELLEGAAQIKMTSGVHLLLEAPAKFQIQSPTQVELSFGNLVARMPEKHDQSFKLVTPSSEIHEASTAIGVSVKHSGKTEVHVLEGKVKARKRGDKEFKPLAKDEALIIELKQQIAEIKSNPKRFLQKLPGTKRGKLAYLHWSFDDLKTGYQHEIHQRDVQTVSRGRGVMDLQRDSGERSYPATLKGHKDSKGPLVTKGPFGNAIDFNGINAWLETEFPGIKGTAPRTVAFWVNVPKDFHRSQGYGILSWGLSAQGKAWQISPNPELRDGPEGRIRIGTSRIQGVGTTDLRDGKWHHIAVVMYGGNQVDMSTHVLIFVDGKLEPMSQKSFAGFYTETESPHSRDLHMGRNLTYHGTTAKTGKSGRNGRGFFRGGLDEVYVFNQALDQKQIMLLMKENRFE